MYLKETNMRSWLWLLGRSEAQFCLCKLKFPFIYRRLEIQICFKGQALFAWRIVHHMVNANDKLKLHRLKQSSLNMCPCVFDVQEDPPTHTYIILLPLL